jgi:hypothetical protein
MLNQKALAASVSAGPKTYVEDVFSTWLYTGNGSTQTITNGIDLSGEGGLVWYKSRNNAVNNALFDTARGAGKLLISDTTNAEGTGYGQSFTSSGFSLTNGGTFYNGSGYTYASWTFRKAAKFFDVVTYTGDGVTDRDLAHNLGSDPGCVIAKAVGTTSNWGVWHRGAGGSNDLTGFELNNTTAAQITNYGRASQFNSTTFAPGRIRDAAINGFNSNGVTYVAYLFAHDAGGFGDAGTDNVVSCGSYAGNGSTTGPVIDLGWEPQWLLVKNATSAGNNWVLIDNMRGFSVTGNQWLYPNDSAAEATTGLPVAPLATGFQPRNSGTFVNESGSTYIYIAIRRGPMKTPEDATKVYTSLTYTGTGATSTKTTGFPVDLVFGRRRDDVSANRFFARITGRAQSLSSTNANEENTSGAGRDVAQFDLQDGVVLGNDDWGSLNLSGSPCSTYYFSRAPGFFDVVGYTGTGVARTVNHNLGVAPELMITKSRSAAGNWCVYFGDNTDFMLLNASNAAADEIGMWNDTSPTSSVFTLGIDSTTNESGTTFIAYLFASCPGVSKVGSYTGTGTTLSVDCGFTAGARFVLIKRTDSTGDWFVWDTARGIISGDDPYLLLNSTAAEVTNTDYIDPLSSGFQISSTAPAAINANGGSFIFLAVA